MATAVPTSDGRIAKFLSLADLNWFDVAFPAEGVTKIDHIMDIAKEDLVRIGKEDESVWIR